MRHYFCFRTFGWHILPAPLGYSTALGELNRLGVDINLSTLGEMTKHGVEIEQAMHWIQLQKTSEPTIKYRHSKMKDADFEKYQLFLDGNLLMLSERLLKQPPNEQPLHFCMPLKHHYKSRFPIMNHSRLHDIFALIDMFWVYTSTCWLYMCTTILWCKVQINCSLPIEN